MKELVCIVCPNGCRMRANGQMKVIGNQCPRGAEYAQKELSNPTRVLTTTVSLQGGSLGRLPVKTDRDIPKGAVWEVMDQARRVRAQAPVHCGDVLMEDVCSLGVNLVATRTVTRPSGS